MHRVATRLAELRGAAVQSAELLTGRRQRSGGMRRLARELEPSDDGADD